MDTNAHNAAPRCPRVLVTGGAGFVAAHLIRELEAGGHEVFTTDAVVPADGRTLPNFRQADLRDRDALAGLNGAIHFFGFKAFENQSLKKMLNYYLISTMMVNSYLT